MEEGRPLEGKGLLGLGIKKVSRRPPAAGREVFLTRQLDKILDLAASGGRILGLGATRRTDPWHATGRAFQAVSRSLIC